MGVVARVRVGAGQIGPTGRWQVRPRAVVGERGEREVRSPPGSSPQPHRALCSGIVGSGGRCFAGSPISNFSSIANLTTYAPH